MSCNQNGISAPTDQRDLAKTRNPAVRNKGSQLTVSMKPAKSKIRIWLFGLLAANATLQCKGDTVIYTPTRGPTETTSIYPLLVKESGLTAMRYQQVYNSTLFTNLDSTNITTLWFSLEYLTSPMVANNWMVPKMQINLSTTPKRADTLSLTFSENVGSDDMVVFGPGSHSFEENVPDAYLGITLERV